MATESENERRVYPDVIASTKMGDDRRYFVEAFTNNNDAGLRMYLYWHIPEDGEQPSLVIELDDEKLGPEDNEIQVRFRRNDGLLYEGTEAKPTVPEIPDNPWDLTRERAGDYEEWQTQAYEGDTLRGFADWVAARDKEES